MPTQQNRAPDSYQTVRSQFVREAVSRSSNALLKDEDFLNNIIESIKNKHLSDSRQFIMKRAGTAVQIASVAASEVRGMFYWDDQDMLFYAVGTDIWSYNFNTQVNTQFAAAFTTTTGDVGFCEFLYDTNVVNIIATDGTSLHQITVGLVLTTCAAPDLPAATLPYPVFLDGYLFLAKAESAEVFNSDLNDPFLWTPGNIIVAEMRADLVQRIAILNNYLVVFGTNSIEYFWDAGNATGSPLQRNDTPIKLNSFLGGFAQHGNEIYFIGENNAGQPEVYRLKDFKLEELANYTVSRYLNTVTDTLATWEGAIVTCQGHAVYLVVAGQVTYACDTETKTWTRWAYQQQTGFYIAHSARATTQALRRSVFALKGNSSSIYYISDTLTQDSGVNFTFRIVTEADNFGSLNRKTMSRFSLIGDQTPDTSYASVSWTDDDYQTYSTPVLVNMRQDLSSIYRLGWFRQRAFKIEYTDAYQFRLQNFEVDINKGIT